MTNLQQTSKKQLLPMIHSRFMCQQLGTSHREPDSKKRPGQTRNEAGQIRTGSEVEPEIQVRARAEKHGAVQNRQFRLTQDYMTIDNARRLMQDAVHNLLVQNQCSAGSRMAHGQGCQLLKMFVFRTSVVWLCRRSFV